MNPILIGKSNGNFSLIEDIYNSLQFIFFQFKTKNYVLFLLCL